MTINLGLVVILFFLIFSMAYTFFEGICPDNKGKEKISYKQDKIRCEKILNDYNEMKNHKYFQLVMRDLNKVIEANKEDIQYINFSCTDNISIRLTDIGDKWTANPLRVICFDTGKYNLKYNREAFIYWILQNYSFLTYHLKEGNIIKETRNIENVVLQYSNDYESYNVTTIIYRIGAEKKYWRNTN